MRYNALPRPRRLIGIGLALIFASLGTLAHGFDWSGRIASDLRDLRSPSARVRRTAVERIAGYSRQAAEQPILNALADVDTTVRLAAAKAAARHRLVRAVPSLIRWLTSADEALRQEGARVLGQLKAKSAVQALIRSLEDPESKTRLRVIRALAEIADARAVIPLLGCLQDPNATVRQAAVEVLTVFGDRRAIPSLMASLGDPARTVRLAAIKALGRLRDPKTAYALTRLLRQADRDIVLGAIDALGDLKSAYAVPELAKLINVGSTTQRRHAIAALARIATVEAVDHLFAALETSSVRQAAQQSLGPVLKTNRYAQARLLRLLRRSPSNQSQTLVAVALAAEAQLGTAVPAIGRLLMHAPLPREELITALQSIGDSRAQRPLLTLIASDAAADLRYAAIRALGGLVDARADQSLIATLDDPDLRIRRLAISYLGRLRIRRAASALRPSVTDANDIVTRRLAARALAEIAATDSAAIFVELLSHQDAALRRSAVLGLGRIHDPRTLAPILRRCRTLAGANHLSCLQALGAASRGRSSDLAFDYLRERLRQPSSAIQSATLDGLAALKDPRIPTLLVDRFASIAAPIRYRVAQIVAHYPSLRARHIRRLTEWLEGGDQKLRSAAAWALLESGAREP